MKQLFYLLLVSLLAVFTTAKAADVVSLTSGGTTTNYASLADAFKAVTSTGKDTIKVLTDISLNVDEYFTVKTGNVTLDLNGKTLAGNIYIFKGLGGNKFYSGFLNVDGGKLTVIDSSSDKTGTLTNVNNSGGALVVYSGSLTINNSNITCPQNAVVAYGGTVTINGGSFSSTQSSTLQVYGSTITINGGRFDRVYKSSDFFSISNGGKIVIGDAYYYQSDPDRGYCSIYEGTITSGSTIYGSGSIHAKYPQSSVNLAEVSVTVDGVTTKTNYKNLRQAFDEAQKATSATVKLLANCSLEEDVIACISKGKITFNLNGKTITANTSPQAPIYGANTSSKALINISGGALTITGNNNGTLKNTHAKGVILEIKQGSGSATIKAGTYEAYNVCHVNGKLTVSGGVFNATNYTFDVAGVQDLTANKTYKANLYLNGGTFTAGQRVISAAQDATATLGGGTYTSDNYTIFAAGGQIFVKDGFVYHADGHEDREGDVTERFTYNGSVVAKSSLPTAIESVTKDETLKVVKTIEHGKIVIIRDGVKYDISGRKL